MINSTTRSRPNPPPSSRRWAWPAACCALAICFAGCAYKLGSTTGETSGTRSITISPIVNRTLEPRLGDVVTQTLRTQVQRDGTYRLDTRDDGDILVTGTVTSYQRNGVTYVPTDVLTTVDARLSITVQVRAVDRVTGRVLLDRSLTGYTLMRVGNDMTSSERQSLPQLADNVCHNITTALVEGTW